MSLPKLFGKEFLPDPNILLNNYDVFMNDPNMDTFLNGSAPKYNPNPNINLRYLYGPDYKIKETDTSAPEPSKQFKSKLQSLIKIIGISQRIKLIPLLTIQKIQNL